MIDINDTDAVYSYGGKLWKVFCHLPEPSVTMWDIGNKDKTKTFGIHSLTSGEFKKVSGLLHDPVGGFKVD